MKNIMQSRIMMPLTRELATYGLLNGGKTLLAGVSGGADSMALLYGLSMLRKTHDFSLHAVHVEHGLRGEASLGDAGFVEEVCKAMDVPLRMYAVDARTAMERLRCGQEEAARTLRYECFREAMEALGGDALLLAHHMDDQAETVLMHLLRGSGPGGLMGMAARKPFGEGVLLRPFLSLRRLELQEALLDMGASWREDETNAQPAGLRNKLRLNVMGQLESLASGCVEAMGRAAFLVGQEEDWWQFEAAQWLRDGARFQRKMCFLLREELAKKHPAYQRRVLRAFYQRALKELGVAGDGGMSSLDFDRTEELRGCLCAQTGKAVNLPGGIRCERSGERLFLIPPGEREDIPPSSLALPGRTAFGEDVFDAVPWHPGQPLGDGILTQALDLRTLEGAVVRCRRPGDIFRLIGGSGTKPLKELLIDRRVDRPFRDMLPLVARGREVLWVPGVGPSGTAAIRPDTARGMVLTLTSPLPWQTGC